MMRISEFEQGSQEWLVERSGKFTGSKMRDLCARTKSGDYASGHRDYIAQLVIETMTGQPLNEFFETADMRWGKEKEPDARAAYEAEMGVSVATVGFVYHPHLERCGASPDGLVGWYEALQAEAEGKSEEELIALRAYWREGHYPSPEGLVEIKCPKSSTHFGYLLAREVPPEYKAQMAWEMACTGAKWCDFVSYDPRMPEHLRLFVIRYHRDDAYIATLAREAANGIIEVDRMISSLPPAPTPAGV